MYAKFVGESYLYNTIDLSPKLPHKFSYRNFKIAGTRLIAGNNSTKLARYCKRLIIGKGWEPNSFVLYDSSDVAYPERRFSVGDVIVTEGNVVVKDNELETWLRSEGVKKDGGLIEATSILGAIINLARNIEVFSLESAFPLSRYQISRLSNLKNMVEVKLNLRQDQRKMVREPTNLDSFIPAPAFKYRPALGRLCGPLLVVLKLYNIPTRNMEWWNEVFAAISGSSKTLRHLALEMPHPITKERYPAYFSSETSMDGDKKSPPKLTWGPTTKDQEDDFRLHLKSLLVRGMILTEDTISFEINPVSPVACNGLLLVCD